MRCWIGSLLAGMILTTPNVWSDVAVVVSNHSVLGALGRSEIMDIYTGRLLTLPNNEIPMPMDLRGTQPLREAFYHALTGKPLAQINSYWAQLLFSGQATPPRILPDTHAMLQAVRQNASAIGFLPVQEVTTDVHVLFVLKTP